MLRGDDKNTYYTSFCCSVSLKWQFDEFRRVRLKRTFSFSASLFDNESTSLWRRKVVCCSFFMASSFATRISCSRRTRSCWSAASTFSFCSSRAISATLASSVCSVLRSRSCNVWLSECRSEFERCSRSRAAFIDFRAASSRIDTQRVSSLLRLATLRWSADLSAAACCRSRT